MLRGVRGVYRGFRIQLGLGGEGFGLGSRHEGIWCPGILAYVDLWASSSESPKPYGIVLGQEMHRLLCTSRNTRTSYLVSIKVSIRHSKIFLERNAGFRCLAS